MNLKKAIIAVLKTLITVGIFVSLFVEFGGGKVAVSRSGFADGSIFYHSNPATPGFLGRLKARFTGTPLPEPYVPLAAVVRPAGDSTGYAVFVVRDSAGAQRARLTRVQLGDVSGNLIAVRQGLAAGDRVIVRGSTIVADGQAVQVMP